MKKRLLKRVTAFLLTLCCCFQVAYAADSLDPDEMSREYQQSYYDWIVTQTCDILGLDENADTFASGLGGFGADGLGVFGAMFFWIQYETGKTDLSAFAEVCLDDGNNGQAYGIQWDLKQGSLQEFLRYCYGKDPAKYAMFQPYLNAPKMDLWSNSSSDPFPMAWKAAFAADPSGFATLQKELAVRNYLDPTLGYLERRGYQLSKRSEVVKGLFLAWAFQWGPGGPQGKLSRVGSPETLNKLSDKDFLTKVYDWRIANESTYASRYRNEKMTALALQAQLDSGNYVSVDSAVQRAILTEALQRRTYGSRSGQCEYWVEAVYQAANTGVHTGTYCCAGHARVKCRIGKAMSADQIPVGATVYSDPLVYRNKGTLGSTQGDNNYGSFQLFGHVGIYIGNNTVISRGNTVYTETWDHWVSHYGNGGYGFCGIKVS